MALRRFGWALVVLSAAGVSDCAFEDPNAPPPLDRCIAERPGAPELGLWAAIDGPPSCPATNPARINAIDGDTIVHFTGSAWTREAAHCRSLDLYFGVAKVTNPDLDMDGVPDIEIRGDAEIPLDAIGYCLVNGGTPSEQVEYSVCGIPSAGQSACEETLVRQDEAKITAEWFNCPGGPRCAPTEHDVCLREVGDGRAYATYVDDPDFFCAGTALESMLDDDQDTLLVVTGTRFKQSSALCIAASAYDSQAGLSFGLGPISRIAQRVVDDAREPPRPILDPTRHPVPNGLADGYCIFNEGTASEFVFYSLCNGQPSGETDDGDAGAPAFEPAYALTRQERCIGTRMVTDEDGERVEMSLWGGRVPKPRKGTWVDCPGGELCSLPLAPR